MSNRFPMASHKKETCSCYRRCGRVAQLEAEAIAAEAARQLRLGESVHMFLLSARVCRRKMHQFSTPLKWLRLRCYAFLCTQYLIKLLLSVEPPRVYRNTSQRIM